MTEGPYKTLKLTEGQGFDWVITKDGNIVTGFDGKPERYDTEPTGAVTVRNAEANASELEKDIARRLDVVARDHSFTLSPLVLLRMAREALFSVATASKD